VSIDILTDVSEERSTYILKVKQSKNSNTTILGKLDLKMDKLRAPETSLFTSTEGVTSRKNVPSSALL
jgi:hypothetical protein